MLCHKLFSQQYPELKAEPLLTLPLKFALCRDRCSQNALLFQEGSEFDASLFCCRYISIDKMPSNVFLATLCKEKIVRVKELRACIIILLPQQAWSVSDRGFFSLPGGGNSSRTV